MAFVMVRHDVNDFQKWKAYFDKEYNFLKQSGCQRFGLYNGKDNPNEVVVFGEWDTAEHAKSFFATDRVKQVMQQSGVSGQPDIIFLSQIDKKILTQETEKTKVA